MRFFEIAVPRVKIVATKRFMKDAAVYLRGGYPGLNKTLQQFLEFKSQHPFEHFGSKDTPFSGGNRFTRSIWHVHLVHGKVIVIYRPFVDQIQLYDMVEHTAVEDADMNRLIDYIANLTSKDFIPMTVSSHSEERQVSSQEKKELDGLLYEMSLSDRDILNAALHDDFVDLLEFMRLTIPNTPDDVLIGAFGGPDGLKQHIGIIMKQMGVA